MSFHHNITAHYNVNPRPSTLTFAARPVSFFPLNTLSFFSNLAGCAARPAFGAAAIAASCGSAWGRLM